jgi:TonB family protein
MNLLLLRPCTLAARSRSAFWLGLRRRWIVSLQALFELEDLLSIAFIPAASLNINVHPIKRNVKTKTRSSTRQSTHHEAFERRTRAIDFSLIWRRHFSCFKYWSGNLMRKGLWTLALLALAATAVPAQNIPGPNIAHRPDIVPEPDQDGVYSFGTGLVRPKLIHGVVAVYPAGKEALGLKRACALDVVINADGVPGKIGSLGTKCNPFEDAAIAAVRQSLFQAGTLQGKAVPVRITVNLAFVPGKDPPIVEMPAKNLQHPSILHSVDPKFSDEARRAKLGGIVVVALIVNENGLPEDEYVIASPGKGLDGAALEAVSKFRFAPATQEGIPVPARMMIEVNFRMY